LFRQGERMSWVLHVDMDQFIAAVEIQRHPELADLPLVVGGRGDPTERGVVSTASYAAREFGVGSGMPLRVAKRKCPEAVFLPVDAPAYEAVSATVMETLRSLSWGGVPVLVQVLGWDEAFVGPGPGHGELGDPEDMAVLVMESVLAATGLHCSVGIGDNTLRAKNATDFGKPRGTYTLTAANWLEVMGDRPTRALWGIGAKIAARLAALGLETVAELAASDPAMLIGAFGPTMGPYYRGLATGASARAIDPEPYVPRAHGRETTFQTDLDDWDAVAAEVRALTMRVLSDIDAEGRPAVRVGLKIRLAPFITVTRSLTLPAPTNDPQELSDAAVSLLDRLDPQQRARPVRLLGVRLEMTTPSKSG
jgi:DNA polymerase-4